MKIHYKWSFSIAMLNYQTVRKMTNGGIGNGPTVYGAGFSEAVSRHPPLMGGHLRALWIIQFESHFFAVTQPKSVYLTCKNIGLQNLMNVYNYHILIRIDHPFAEKTTVYWCFYPMRLSITMSSYIISIHNLISSDIVI